MSYRATTAQQRPPTQGDLRTTATAAATIGNSSTVGRGYNNSINTTPHSLTSHHQQQQQQQSDVEIASAIPTLRVMRLQKPELHISTSALPSSIGTSAILRDKYGTLLYETNPCILQTSLCLPDSLTVYVGETFTAYLGVLNAPNMNDPTVQYPPIRRLTVVAQLQTPSQRYPLPSRLDPQQQQPGYATHVNNSLGLDVPVGSGVDAIVSRIIEEAGQHILRVEVGYMTPDGNRTTFRKFYRFQVRQPIYVTEQCTIRTSDTSCITCIHVEYPIVENEKQDPMIVSSINFETANGLDATNMDCGRSVSRTTTNSNRAIVDAAEDVISPAQSVYPTAVQLLDGAQSIIPGGKASYMFNIEATSGDATIRGIAAGDCLGRIVLSWRKAMGEYGTIYSPSIYCPQVDNTKYHGSAPTGVGSNGIVSRTNLHPVESHNFVAYRSGRSVDVAAAAAAVSMTSLDHNQHLQPFYITVEPIDPPVRMRLHVPKEVKFLVVNHTNDTLTLQIQFTISQMDPGLVICGPSYQNLGSIARQGGSIVTVLNFLPLRSGLFRVQGCTVVDVASGREAVQPPLWTTFVE
jgi:trafficking protein particle complex subunit 13